jgi:hypothetical protein
MVMMLASGPLLQTTFAQRLKGSVGLTVMPPNIPEACTPALLTQSTSQAVTPGNSQAPLIIAPPGAQDNSSYWRAFNIANFIPGNSLAVTSVDIGVQSVTTGAKSVTVNLWSSSAAFPAGFPNSLSLLGTAMASIAVQSGTIVNIPVTGTAQAGSQLVVEIKVPGYPAVGNASQFVIGSNAAAENGPSYVSSENGSPTPLTTTQFGLPNMHIVMNVNGCATPSGQGGSLTFAPWTGTASAGTVDEDSLAIMQVTNFTLGLLPTATGTVTSRYNVTGVTGLSRFCPASQSKVSLRFRDSDAGGSAAQVVVELHRSNVATGGNEIIFSFDSNVSAQPLGGSFQTFTATPALGFDFTTYIYWIEAKVTKTDPNAFANLGSMQIYESAGTACP